VSETAQKNGPDFVYDCHSICRGVSEAAETHAYAASMWLTGSGSGPAEWVQLHSDQM